MGCVPLIQKDSIAHMHGLAVCLKEGLPFERDVSLESRILLMYWLPLSLCTAFYSVSSNIDDVFSTNSSANVFVFGDFDIHDKDSLSYSSRNDKPGELCYDFLLQITLLWWLFFLLGSLTDSQGPAALDFFFLALIFVLQWLSLHWEFQIMLLSQLPLIFCQTQNGMPCFIT